jgi:hypothetical protein
MEAEQYAVKSKCSQNDTDQNVQKLQDDLEKNNRSLELVPCGEMVEIQQPARCPWCTKKRNGNTLE